MSLQNGYPELDKLSDTEGAQIYQTKNYDKFNFLKENREINSNHINRLCDSISKNNKLHLKPIIVNENYEVIDGQHRLTAAKKLDVPIYYQIDKSHNLKDIINLNVNQERWRFEDYLNFWVMEGKTDYIKLYEFWKETEFTLSIALRWMGVGGHALTYFREGKYKFSVSHEILDALFHTKNLLKFLNEKGILEKRFNFSAAFHKAAKKFFLSPFVDANRFFNRLKVAYHLITYHAKADNYLEMLVKVYNYDVRQNKLKMITEGKSIEICQ
jgi:hypothetical protein